MRVKATTDELRPLLSCLGGQCALTIRSSGRIALPLVDSRRTRDSNAEGLTTPGRTHPPSQADAIQPPSSGFRAFLQKLAGLMGTVTDRAYTMRTQ